MVTAFWTKVIEGPFAKRIGNIRNCDNFVGRFSEIDDFWISVMILDSDIIQY